MKSPSQNRINPIEAKRAIGKKYIIPHVDKIAREILEFGDRDKLYQAYDQNIPHNPMGYSTDQGLCVAVKDDRGRVRILPSRASIEIISIYRAQKHIPKRLKNADISKLNIKDTVYYKVTADQYVQGTVFDKFGESGVFLMFDNEIQLEDDYADRDFEVYVGEGHDNHIYIKK